MKNQPILSNQSPVMAQTQTQVPPAESAPPRFC